MEITSVSTNAYTAPINASSNNNGNNGNGNGNNANKIENRETNFVLRNINDTKADFSPSALLMGEMSIKLLSTMKTIRLTEPQIEPNQEDPLGIKNPENYLKQLAEAYHKMQSELNENSESSNKHGKFLDDAFQGVARMLVEQNTQINERNEQFVNQSVKNDINAIIANAKKQADIFSDLFLKNYKKHGMEAFFIAMSAFKS